MTNKLTANQAKILSNNALAMKKEKEAKEIQALLDSIYNNIRYACGIGLFTIWCDLPTTFVTQIKLELENNDNAYTVSESSTPSIAPGKPGKIQTLCISWS